MEGADAPLSSRRAPMNEPVFDIRKQTLMDRFLHISLYPDSTQLTAREAQLRALHLESHALSHRRNYQAL